MAAQLRTPEKEIAFLAALAATCSVTRACEAAGIGRQTAYDWRASDPAFAARWEEAKAIGAEALEDEAVRRGREGWEEPVFHLGVATDTIRKYDSTLLIFLLKGAKPEKYRDNAKVELSGHLSMSEMSDDEIRAELATLLGTDALPASDDDVGDLL